MSKKSVSFTENGGGFEVVPKERRRSSHEVLCRFVLLVTNFLKRSDRPARSPNFTNTAERIGERLSLAYGHAVVVGKFTYWWFYSCNLKGKNTQQQTSAYKVFPTHQVVSVVHQTATFSSVQCINFSNTMSPKHSVSWLNGDKMKKKN